MSTTQFYFLMQKYLKRNKKRTKSTLWITIEKLHSLIKTVDFTAAVSSVTQINSEFK